MYFYLNQYFISYILSKNLIISSIQLDYYTDDNCDIGQINCKKIFSKKKLLQQ